MATRTAPRFPRFLPALSAFATLFLFAAPALAAGGSTPLDSFGHNIVNFMSNTLGPIVLAVGLGFAAAGIIFGMPGGLQRALMAAVGGVLLVFAEPIATMLLGWGGR